MECLDVLDSLERMEPMAYVDPKEILEVPDRLDLLDDLDETETLVCLVLLERKLKEKPCLDLLDRLEETEILAPLESRDKRENEENVGTWDHLEQLEFLGNVDLLVFKARKERRVKLAHLDRWARRETLDCKASRVHLVSKELLDW